MQDIHQTPYIGVHLMLIQNNKLPLFIQKLDKEQINYQIIKSNNLKHIKQELNLC